MGVEEVEVQSRCVGRGRGGEGEFEEDLGQGLVDVQVGGEGLADLVQVYVFAVVVEKAAASLSVTFQVAMCMEKSRAFCWLGEGTTD